MNSSIRPAFASVALLLAALVSPLAAAPKDDLLEAASASEPAALVNALAAGAKPDVRDAKGRTALMLAAEAGSFSCVRELLWAGADPSLKDRSGRTAHDYVGEPSDENRPVRILLRCYTYLRPRAKRATTAPANPSLVMIMEPTVNYLHPKLKPLYHVNQAELSGAAGKDDDNNGFIDDVYGWSPVTNTPYQIREAQLNAYLKNREAVARIIKIDNDRVEGRITSEEAELRLAEYSNPLSDIMGPLGGLDDDHFLDLVKQAAHGTHVAGIIVEASEGKARLHTVGLNFAEESRRILGPGTDRIIDELHAKSFDHDAVLGQIRAKLLEHSTERGRRISRYLQLTGCGVVNMSFGGGMDWWTGYAAQQIMRCVERRAEMDPASVPSDEELEEVARHWGFELYSANAAELALVIYENPDVLFCAAAGNEDVNNDEALVYPAYLSRFFPNVTTVASVDRQDRISRFSNFGVDSVNIAAIGEDVLSTVIPETPIYMDGTSMATPYVAGVAAYIRSIAPKLTAAELRQMIDYTSRDIEQLHRFVSAGGIIDKAVLRDLYAGDAKARARACARVAGNAALLAPSVYPRHAADAERYSAEAIKLDPKSGEAWRSRSLTLYRAGDSDGAVAAMDKATAAEPGNESIWIDRANLYAELGDAAQVLMSLEKSIAILAAQGESANFLRARRLVLRAGLYVQLEEVDAARQDLRLALELNPGLDLPEELAALLEGA
jgi:subtilisin family serine protease/Tfp pilus assembly protein PilF